VAMVGDSINDAPTSGIEHRRVAMGPPEAWYGNWNLCALMNDKLSLMFLIRQQKTLLRIKTNTDYIV
jgi:hypothetical protein